VSKLYLQPNMPEHDQLDIHAGLAEGRLGAGTVYPCAVPGISLTDYSRDPGAEGLGAALHRPVHHDHPVQRGEGHLRLTHRRAGDADSQ
jgi:hypothetical protein